VSASGAGKRLIVPSMVCARLRHMEGSKWGTVPCMSMKHLETCGNEAMQTG
jgi:hypothetical protein